MNHMLSLEVGAELTSVPVRGNGGGGSA